MLYARLLNSITYRLMTSEASSETSIVRARRADPQHQVGSGNHTTNRYPTMVSVRFANCASAIVFCTRNEPDLKSGFLIGLRAFRVCLKHTPDHPRCMQRMLDSGLQRPQ
jgi:hypothetical protein